jgi:hypothetical protein
MNPLVWISGPGRTAAAPAASSAVESDDVARMRKDCTDDDTSRCTAISIGRVSDAMSGDQQYHELRR